MAITVYNGPLGTYSAKSRTSGTDQVQVVEIDDLAVQIDEGATYTYIGYAAPGTLTAAATWKIKRMTNASGVIVWADGDSNFDNVYDDRTSLTYS